MILPGEAACVRRSRSSPSSRVIFDFDAAELNLMLRNGFDHYPYRRFDDSRFWMRCRALVGQARSVAGVVIWCRDTPAGCLTSRRDQPKFSR
jgi:hypothetical protein